MKHYSGMSDKTDIKIFILFLLDEIRYPLDDVTLSRIIQENGYLGMFDFAECFSELQELGHIQTDEVNGVKFYSISDSGHMVASELQDNILASIREKSSHSAAKLLSLHKRGATPSCAAERLQDGRWQFTAAVQEKGGDLLHLSVVLSSREEAEQMKAHFTEKPEDVLRGLRSVLTGEIEYLL